MVSGRELVLGVVLVVVAAEWARGQPVADSCREATCSVGAWGVPRIASCAFSLSTLDSGEAANSLGFQSWKSTPSPQLHSVACSFATFSPPPLEPITAPVVRAPEQNSELCFELNKDYDATGVLLVVSRGTCTMWKKARAAHKAGAAGLIVVDTTNSSFVHRMRASKPKPTEDNAMPMLPALMVTNATGQHLQSLGVPVLQPSTGQPVLATEHMRVMGTLSASFDAWHPLSQEFQDWSRVKEAIAADAGAGADKGGKGRTSAAHKVLAWGLERLGWKDDARRADQYAARLASKATRAVNLAHPEHAETWNALVELAPDAKQHLEDIQLQLYRQLAPLYPRVCEVGLRQGAAALAFLHAGAESYMGFAPPLQGAKEVAAFLQARFPDRTAFQVLDRPTQGLSDWARRLPLGVTCDTVIIEAAGNATGAVLDIMSQIVSPDHVLIMHNTPCVKVQCQIPTHEWETREADGRIVTYQRSYFSPPRGSARSKGFSVGKFGFPGEHTVLRKTKERGLSRDQIQDSAINRTEYFGRLVNRSSSSEANMTIEGTEAELEEGNGVNHDTGNSTDDRRDASGGNLATDELPATVVSPPLPESEAPSKETPPRGGEHELSSSEAMSATVTPESDIEAE